MSLRAGALVTAVTSTHCHGNEMDFCFNVTSLSSMEIDRAGNEKIASTGSRPTLAVLPVVSPTRRQFHGSVGDHVTVNTKQIHPQVVSYVHSASSYQLSKDTVFVHHHHHQQQQQQQHETETGRTQSVWNKFKITSRNNRDATVDSDLCHSAKVTSSSTSASSTPSSRRRVMLGRCVERRRAATERERHRLRRVNCAFDELRDRTCHHSIAARRLPGHRLSKLDILRRAISYIEHLEQLLNNNVHITRASNVQKTVNVVSNFWRNGQIYNLVHRECLARDIKDQSRI